MGFVESAKKLLKWQPQAVDIRDAGACDCCKRQAFVFYRMGDETRADYEGYVMGGFYCAACGWGNAGAMRREEYQRAQRYEG